MLTQGYAYSLEQLMMEAYGTELAEFFSGKAIMEPADFARRVLDSLNINAATGSADLSDLLKVPCSVEASVLCLCRCCCWCFHFVVAVAGVGVPVISGVSVGFSAGCLYQRWCCFQQQ